MTVSTTNKQRSGLRLKIVLILIILGAVVIPCLLIIVIPFFQTGGGNADTREVPGDATRFDPVIALPSVMTYASQDAQLTSLKAYYVRSDGTMDLTAKYNPRVEYEFIVKVPPPADAPPVGAGGTLDGAWWQRITVKAYQPGKWWHVTSGSSEYDYMNKGMERDTSRPTTYKPDVLALPTCSFGNFWKAALEKNAPANAVATIEYDTRGYHFSINDTPIRLDFGTDCRMQATR